MYTCRKILIVLCILALTHQNVQAQCRDEYQTNTQKWWSCCEGKPGPTGTLECTALGEYGGHVKYCYPPYKGYIDVWRCVQGYF